MAGLPIPVEMLFIVDSALGRVTPEGEVRVRKLIGIMDQIECRLEAAQVRLAATELADLKVRQDECDALEREYVRWGHRLAEALHSPVYKYSERYRTGGGPSVRNIKVVG